MLFFILWIIGSIAALYISIEFMRSSEIIEYKSAADIREEFILMLFLSIVGSWLFAVIIGVVYVVKKYEKNIIEYIKGGKNEKQ